MGPDNPSGTSASGSSAVSQQPTTVAYATQPNIQKIEHVSSSIVKMKDTLDDTNWIVWRERIRRIFSLCNVEEYVYGTLPTPDPLLATPSLANWRANDIYAQVLITMNINKDQMVHVSRLNTAHEIWKSLESIHETHDYQVAIAIQRDLFRQCASDGDDIVDHLTRLKKKWERLNVLDDEDFRITDIQFKPSLRHLSHVRGTRLPNRMLGGARGPSRMTLRSYQALKSLLES